MKTPLEAAAVAAALGAVIDSSARVERNRIYTGVKRLCVATSPDTAHGRAQRVAYRRVLDVITYQTEATR